MNYDYKQTLLSKSILGGAFAGIGVTLLNLAYDYFYRNAVQFYPSQIINVSSIIFATMLVFTIAGYIHFLLNKFFKYGDIVYILIFGSLAIICFFGGTQVNRSADPAEIVKFRGLLLGIEAPSGVLLAFLVPYLVKHESIYC